MPTPNLRKALLMQKTSQQQLFKITVVLASFKERVVPVKASSLEVAERRALKRTNGISIKRGES